MEQLFLTRGRTEDLIGWATKLDCLGNIIATLGESKDADICLQFNGSALGYIIMDYASALKATLEESYSAISETLDTFDWSSFGAIERSSKIAMNTFNSNDKKANIKENLQAISEVKEKFKHLNTLEKVLKKELEKTVI